MEINKICNKLIIAASAQRNDFFQNFESLDENLKKNHFNLIIRSYSRFVSRRSEFATEKGIFLCWKLIS